MNILLLSIFFFYPLNSFSTTFQKGHIKVGSEFYFFTSDKYYDYYGNLHRYDFKFLERRMTFNIELMVTERFSMWLSIPWVWREVDAPWATFEYISGDLYWIPLISKSKGNGLGDVWGGLDWAYTYKWMKGGIFVLMKFPTGKEGLGEHTLPLGTGQFDLGIGAKAGVNFSYLKIGASLNYLWRNDGNPPYLSLLPFGIGTSVDPGDQLWIDIICSLRLKGFELGAHFNGVFRTGDEYSWNEIDKDTGEVIHRDEVFVRSNSFYLLPFVGFNSERFGGKIELIYPVAGASYPAIMGSSSIFPTIVGFPYTYNLPWYPSTGMKASLWYVF